MRKYYWLWGILVAICAAASIAAIMLLLQTMAVQDAFLHLTNDVSDPVYFGRTLGSVLVVVAVGIFAFCYRHHFFRSEQISQQTR